MAAEDDVLNGDGYIDVERGKVKWFDGKIGYGFIVPDNGAKETFVHQSEIAVHGFRRLSPGNHVEYVVDGEGDRRKARAVVVLSTLD